MSNRNLPGFAELDRDGAIEEAASKVDGHTRQAFLRRTGAFMGAGAAFAVLPAGAFAAGGVPKSDVAILNFALTLEYLEADFYKKGQSLGLSSSVKKLAKQLGDEESEHVTALAATVKKLGGTAVKKPTFSFGVTDEKSFLKLAQTLEDTGVGAYNAAGPLLKSKEVLGAAGSIVQIEARHAAAIRLARGNAPAPSAFDKAIPMDKVLAAVKPLIKA